MSLLDRDTDASALETHALFLAQKNGVILIPRSTSSVSEHKYETVGKAHAVQWLMNVRFISTFYHNNAHLWQALQFLKAIQQMKTLINASVTHDQSEFIKWWNYFRWMKNHERNISQDPADRIFPFFPFFFFSIFLVSVSTIDITETERPKLIFYRTSSFVLFGSHGKRQTVSKLVCLQSRNKPQAKFL